MYKAYRSGDSEVFKDCSAVFLYSDRHCADLCLQRADAADEHAESDLRKELKINREFKKGFTLLEMTIVVLIISVLFLLTVPNIQKTLSIVNSKGCKALEKVGDAAIVQYKLEYGEYPGSVSDLVSAGLLSEDQVTCDGSHTLVISDGQAYID